MNAITLNTAAAAITDAVKVSNQAENKWVKATDLLISRGITAAMLAPEKSGGNPELRDATKHAIVAGFTSADQSLLAKEPKSLDDAAKKAKKELQQKVGSLVGHIQRLLRDREDKPEGEEVTDIERIQKALSEVVKKIQKLENVTFDVVDIVKRLNSVKGAMPAK